MPTEHPPQWLTTKQCAVKLGMSTDFVLGEIRDGRMEAHVIARDGKRTVYRISAESLERYRHRFWGLAADMVR